MTKLSALALWFATAVVIAAGWWVWFTVTAPLIAEINAMDPQPARTLKLYAEVYLPPIVVWAGGGILTGLWCGATRRKVLGSRAFLIFVSALVCLPYLLGNLLGYPLGLLFNRRPGQARGQNSTGPKDWDWIVQQPDTMEGARELVRHRTGAEPGAWLGWADFLITAPPRGGVLVIGPPGSGKTTGVITPTVMLAPGACVSSSIKSDVMNQTAALRARYGRVWHFDPGGDEITPAGVEAVRWSPLASVHNWDDALRVGKTMGDSLNTRGDEAGGHFLARAVDWVQCLLYAAHLQGATIGTVATWAATAADEETAATTLSILERANQAGDEGAGIAWAKLRGLLTAPDRERGSIISTMSRLLSVYDSLAARRTGEQSNFDPVQFVRSRDTLYITARPDKQDLYAPLLAALLEQIRFATYDRQKRIMAGHEPAQPHVTFALDEANTTAPIPLPSIISEAGGQGLHVVVGIQALGPSEARWGRAAASFLTLFPTKVVLRGVFDRDTVTALSIAAGEYDRALVTENQGRQFIGGSLFRSGWVDTTSYSHSTSRQRVIDEAAITGVPQWQALVWSGADWDYVHLAKPWEDPVLTTALAQGMTQP